jgi:hypothetical protein
MTEDRTFAVASEKALVEMILRARKRLVVIAPELTQTLADALSRRGDLHVAVIPRVAVRAGDRPRRKLAPF